MAAGQTGRSPRLLSQAAPDEQPPPGRVWTPPETRHPRFSGQLCRGLTTHRAKILLRSNLHFIFQLKPIPSCPTTIRSHKKPALLLLTCKQYWKAAVRTMESCPSWTNPTPSTFPHRSGAPGLYRKHKGLVSSSTGIYIKLIWKHWVNYRNTSLGCTLCPSSTTLPRTTVPLDTKSNPRRYSSQGS